MRADSSRHEHFVFASAADVADAESLMQSEAVFIAVLTESPSVQAAAAMPVPTIASINAYSAAEAPL